MKIQVKTITPTLATRWLEKNKSNRRVRLGVVDQYARDMAAGNWMLTAEAIKFNGDGTLLDGQHRLLACAKAGVSFQSLVATGLESDVRVAMDTGAKRTFGDVLRWRGETDVANLAAAISWCYRYEKGILRDPQQRPSHAELLLWLEKNPEVREANAAASVVYRQIRITRAPLAGLHFFGSKIDPVDTEVFFESLRSGEDLTEGSPILALRRWAERALLSRDKVPSLRYAAVTIKAFNYWREGRSVSSLGWRAGGAQAEEFPTIGTVNSEFTESVAA